MLLHTADAHTVLTDIVANNIEKFNYTTRNAAKFANGNLSLLIPLPQENTKTAE
jgi:hypothetical protein